MENYKNCGYSKCCNEFVPVQLQKYCCEECCSKAANERMVHKKRMEIRKLIEEEGAEKILNRFAKNRNKWQIPKGIKSKYSVMDW